MNVLRVENNNRILEASLDADAAVLIREEGKVDARYSVAEGVLALAEQKGPDRVIGSTIDEVLQALVHKHAAR
jgi:hypothetical protein